LVDEDRFLVDSFGGAEALCKVRRRRPSMNVLDMLEGDLRAMVASAIHRAFTSRGPADVGAVRISDEQGERRGRVGAPILFPPRTGARQALVTFGEPRLPLVHEEQPA